MATLVYHLKYFRRLLLLTSVFFCTGTITELSAQSIEDVCRETMKVLEQYQREEIAAYSNLQLKRTEDEVRKNYAGLQTAVANNQVWPQKQLEFWADSLHVTLPREVGKMSTEERKVFQKKLKSSMELYIQKIADLDVEEISQQMSQLEEQIKTRSARLLELNCAAILKQSEEKTISLAGTWKAFKWVYEFEQTGKTFSWRITNDEAYGEKADGEFIDKNRIKATWKNKNGTDSSEGTVVVKNGRVVSIEWDNHAVFTKSD